MNVFKRFVQLTVSLNVSAFVLFLFRLCFHVFDSFFFFHSVITPDTKMADYWVEALECLVEISRKYRFLLPQRR